MKNARALPTTPAVLAVLVALAGVARADEPRQADPVLPPLVRPTPLVPRSGEKTLFDFEDGSVPEASTAAYGLKFVTRTERSKDNIGVYTWAIDSGGGAEGTHHSLRLDVASGNFYIWTECLDRRRYLEAARGANRFSFWIKLPRGWGDGLSPYNNFHIGTYLRDPRVWRGEPESNNNHHYFQLYLRPD